MVVGKVKPTFVCRHVDNFFAAGVPGPRGFGLVSARGRIVTENDEIHTSLRKLAQSKRGWGEDGEPSNVICGQTRARADNHAGTHVLRVSSGTISGDERSHPGLMKQDIRVRAADMEAILAGLGID